MESRDQGLSKGGHPRTHEPAGRSLEVHCATLCVCIQPLRKIHVELGGGCGPGGRGSRGRRIAYPLI